MSMCNQHDAPAIRETLPVSLIAESRQNYIVTVGIPIALFSLAMSIGAGLHSGWQSSLLISLVFWPVAGLFVFGTASVLDHNLRTQIPTVELRNDEVVVRYGERRLAAKIEDCHLHRGRVIWMRLVGGVRLYCWRPVILIDLPPYWNSKIGIRHPRLNTVAVGYSREMQQKWERALLPCTANKRLNVSGGSRGT